MLDARCVEWVSRADRLLVFFLMDGEQDGQGGGGVSSEDGSDRLQVVVVVIYGVLEFGRAGSCVSSREGVGRIEKSKGRIEKVKGKEVEECQGASVLGREKGGRKRLWRAG
jgi:hypothetical protein